MGRACTLRPGAPAARRERRREASGCEAATIAARLQADLLVLDRSDVGCVEGIVIARRQTLCLVAACIAVGPPPPIGADSKDDREHLAADDLRGPRHHRQRYEGHPLPTGQG